MYSPPICCACFQGTMRWIAVAALAAVLAVASAHGARVGRGQWVNSAAARDTVVASQSQSPKPSLSPNSSRCGPASSCTYTYHDPSTSKTYTYDFSSLCQETDYEIKDAVGHTYYANICGRTQHNCLPGAYLCRAALCPLCTHPHVVGACLLASKWW